MPPRRNANTNWNVLNEDESTSLQKKTIPEGNPYYLHGSDHPGLILVPYQFTGVSNFLSWKRSMTIALGAKTKLQFINGKCTKPSDGDEYAAIWEKVDWTVLSWILNCLSKELNDTFVHTRTSKELWDTL